tara:strand:- start:2822 stop:2992 length:171 start_codon:yes stop_codon:yes gene_type:complete
MLYDYMQWSRAYGMERASDPRRIRFHEREKEGGFYHDEDGEPSDAYIEPEQELFFN